MILYHGTSTEHLDRILREGLLPRIRSGNAGYWEGEIQSKPFVYLSTAYAVYYAVHAAGEEHDPVLLQVEVPEKDLYPEEDFLAWHLSDRTNEGLRKKIAELDPSDYQHHWSDSLRYCGNVCTKQVSPTAIRAHRVIPIEGNLELLLNTGWDAIPAEVNYQCYGNYYRSCLNAYFCHELTELPAVVAALYETDQRRQFGDETYELRQQQLERIQLNLAIPVN